MIFQLGKAKWQSGTVAQMGLDLINEAHRQRHQIKPLQKRAPLFGSQLEKVYK